MHAETISLHHVSPTRSIGLHHLNIKTSGDLKILKQQSFANKQVPTDGTQGTS